MRILHVVGGLDRGGAETWLVQVLRHIDRSKYQFDFLVHTEKPCAYDDEVRALGSRIIPCLSPAKPVKYARNFLRILKQYGPYDCVHSHVHHFSGLPLMLARFARVPMRVIHSHLDTAQLEANSNVMRHAYMRLMKRMIWATATRGSAVSKRAGDSLFPPKWKESERWVCAPLGIDLKPFHASVDRGEARRELGIPADAFVVGHVGRFVAQKNHSFLIEVAAAMTSETKFLLVGDGPLLPEVHNKIATLQLKQNVIFLGVRSDIAKLMKGVMDAFILPSCYEGLGLVVMEAQAAGLPCLVSDVVPEEADANLGLVWKLSLNTPPSAWADQLAKLRDQRSELGPAPTIRSIENSAQDLLRLYAGMPHAAPLAAVAGERGGAH